MGGFPPDFHATVRENWPRTLGWLIAGKEPCLSTGHDEETAINRLLESVVPGELEDIELPDSWFAAVLFCPGDDLTAILAWMKRLSLDKRERVKFYCHPSIDPDAAFAQFPASGLSIPRNATLSEMSLRVFHPIFGRDLAWQVYLDAKERAATAHETAQS